MKKTITSILIGASLTGALLTPTVYKSLKVSEEAHNRVKHYAALFDMTYQDTASLMILGYTDSPFPDYPIRVRYSDMDCYVNEEGFKQYQKNQEDIKQGITVYEVIAGERCFNN